MFVLANIASAYCIPLQLDGCYGTLINIKTIYNDRVHTLLCNGNDWV